MEFLGNVLFFIGLILFIYGPIQLIRALINAKEPERRNELMKKSVIGFTSSIFLLVVGSNSSPVESNAQEEVAVKSEEVVAEESTSEEERKEEEKRKEKERKKEEAEEQKEKEKKEKEQKKEEEKKQKELDETNPNESKQFSAPSKTVSVPSSETHGVINNNVPYFSNEDISSTEAYHKNGSYDSLGRVTAANAIVGVEIMPAEERGSISHIKPTGWDQARYAGIGSGGWLYNRSHLIGHQMTGNDEPQNLMTGTRWFNERMLEYENFVANYVETTENHVRYRVTPVFEGNNLLASGAYMEGFSIEDNGEGIMFNIYIPNRQPNVEINYANGSSVGPEGPAEEGTIKPYNSGGSSNSSKSQPSQPAPQPKPAPTPPPAPAPQPEKPASTGGDVSSIDANGNGKVTIAEAEAAGFSMPIYSDHWLYHHMDDRDSDGMVGE